MRRCPSASYSQIMVVVDSTAMHFAHAPLAAKQGHKGVTQSCQGSAELKKKAR